MEPSPSAKPDEKEKPPRSGLATSLSSTLSPSGGLILGLIYVLAGVFTASLGLNTWQHTSETRTILYIVGSILFVAICAALYISLRSTHKPESSQFALKIADAEFTANNTDLSGVLPLMQDLLQNRKPLPAPFGEVVGDPSDKGALRAYTDDERDAISKLILEDGERRKREFIELIQTEVRIALSDGLSEPPVFRTATKAPIPEPPDI